MEEDEVLRIIEEAVESKQTSLDLSNNQLTALPHEITKLTNLTELNLSDNQLTALPPEINEAYKSYRASPIQYSTDSTSA